MKANEVVTLDKEIISQLQEEDVVICNGDGRLVGPHFLGRIRRTMPTRIEIERYDGMTGGGIMGAWVVGINTSGLTKILKFDMNKFLTKPGRSMQFGDIFIDGEFTDGRPKINVVVQIGDRTNFYAKDFAIDNVTTHRRNDTLIKYKRSESYRVLFNSTGLLNNCTHSGCRQPSAIYIPRIGYLCAEHTLRRGLVDCPDCGVRFAADFGINLPRHSNNHIINRFYCESCGMIRQNRNKPIKSYSYKPEPKFISMSPASEELATKLFMGVELETELNPPQEEISPSTRDEMNRRITPLDPRPVRRSAEDCAAVVRKASKKFNTNPKDWFYAKHDGSIHNGFEVVTEPATLEAHQKIIPWGDFLKFLQEQGCNSDTVTTCGLHVHANKEHLSEEHRIKLGLFINIQRRNMEKLARREASRWAQFKQGCADISELSRFCRNETGGKYEALNWQPPHTVEYRLFKGTLDPDILLASLELVQASILFTGLPSIKVSHLREVSRSWGAFGEYIKTKDYPTLEPYMAKKGVI